MTHALDQAVRDLQSAIAHLKALYADPLVAPFGRCRAREKVFAASDKLEEVRTAPLKITPWNDGGAA